MHGNIKFILNSNATCRIDKLCIILRIIFTALTAFKIILGGILSLSNLLFFFSYYSYILTLCNFS